ncbi:hypothetical protein [Streptomyces termitum]|uniref:hypothetical protein n=1 Tax=Streptomyces termitum TaxID=67368 RepID=UPI0033A8598D
MAEARALDLPGTAEELRRYRRGGLTLTAAGVLLVVLSGLGFALLPEEPEWAVDLAGFTGVAGVLTFLFGPFRLLYAFRFRRVLASGPWSAHLAVAVSGGRGERVVLAGPDGGLWPLRVIATAARWAEVRPGGTGVLWWCGDPRKGGVLSAPGGGPLFRVKPVRGSAERLRLVEFAEGLGLAELPAPAQPHDAVGGGEAAPPSRARFDAHARPWSPSGRRPSAPEPDVRTAPWWRVRGLRRLAGLHRVGFGLIGTAAYGVLVGMDVFWPDPEAEVPGRPSVWSLLLLAAAVAWVLWSCVQVVVRGLPVVRLLVRAALAPVPDERRYALVPAPVGNGLFLVVFPAHGGPDDRPDGVLPLMPPERPVAATGTVELRGWLDRAGDGGDPVVVARYDGRPLWPAGPYLEAGSRDGAELLGELAALLGSERAPEAEAQA